MGKISSVSFCRKYIRIRLWWGVLISEGQFWRETTIENNQFSVIKKICLMHPWRENVLQGTDVNRICHYINGDYLKLRHFKKTSMVRRIVFVFVFLCVFFSLKFVCFPGGVYVWHGLRIVFDKQGWVGGYSQNILLKKSSKKTPFSVEIKKTKHLKCFHFKLCF